MINEDAAAMEAEKRREQAKNDARILAEAEVIHQDEGRYSLAREVAIDMALKSGQEAKALSDVASGLLSYPKMGQGEQSVS